MAACGARASQWPTRTRVVLFALVVLVAGLVRFVGLGKESIWLDEATSILIGRMNLPSVVAWAAADIHPPLYYLVLHFWLYLGESEFAVRSLSAVLGVLSVVIIHGLARELFGTRVGLLAALLLALSPLHIWYSQETRMYMMVATWSLLASYLLLLALRRGRAGYWLGYMLAAVCSLYTHYFAAFVLLFHTLFVIYWLWQNRAARSLWRRWLLAGVVIAVLFLPWVPVAYRQVSGGGGGWVERSIGRPSLRALVDTWLYFSIGLEGRIYPSLVRRVAYGLFGLALVAALWSLLPAYTLVGRRLVASRRDREGLLFCLTWLCLPLLMVWGLSQVKPMYTIRYLLPFLPPYCIIVARGVDGLRWNWGRAAIAASLVAVLLIGVWSTWQVEQKDDWRGASSYVLARARQSDVALFSPRWNIKPFEYYARDRVDGNMDLPMPVTWEAAQAVAADVAQRYQRVWLFWQSSHYSDRDGLAKQALESWFRMVEERDFRGVGTLILYELVGGTESP